MIDFQLKNYEDLELSTQILLREALKRGIEIEVLDRQANFVKLRKGKHIEYIKEATKTRLDSYITFLIMENKQVTKYILREAGFSVPHGKQYYEAKKAIQDFNSYRHKNIVVKPTNTNFGIGVAIIKKASKSSYKNAVIQAFQKDNSIIVEDFVVGKEYRFLVIGKKVIAIIHRIPANVIGDGKHSISQLVKMKNQDVRRGKGYKTPLEYIQLGKTEKLMLTEQKLNFSSIPIKNNQIFLRQNSNISTGGDSMDYTDEIPAAYKKIAIQAAASVGAKICGVDMIIENLKQNPHSFKYAIIELNFNPILHIHGYPYQGKGRNVAASIFDLLDF